jgi:hypothetical protein
MKEKCLSIFIVLVMILSPSFIYNNDHFSKSTDEIQSQERVSEDISNSDVSELLSTAPKAFTANHGQLENDEVLFYDQGGTVWFTADGMWMEIREYVEPRGQSGVRVTPQTLNSQNSYNSRIPTPTHQYKRVILKQEFVGANIVKAIGRERLNWKSNFYYGNDSSKWCTEVPNYEEVYYENLYDGIDLRYYWNENGLKYDFIVHPGADPNKIRLRYIGAEGLEIDNHGNLIINTAIQDIIDGDLFIYQDYANDLYPIEGKFIKYNNIEYGFEILQNYNEQEVLVIDPNFKLEYSTFIGGSNMEWFCELSMDQPGNLYVTGRTNSFDFPNTTGAYDQTYNGDIDIYVMKLDNNYNINYSTYIGGSDIDGATSIAVESNGTALISGETFSTDFPTTPGAYDPIFNGISDVYVLKLDSSGSNLLFSTFIGGSGHESGCLAIDFFGNAYVTGATNSSDFPTTPGAYDMSYNDDYDVDAFIFKLSQNGSMLNYSTFIGGDNNDSAADIVIDSRGNAYITGRTESLNFPTTAGAINTSFNGMLDIFVLKLNQNGTSLVYSTYLGGMNMDWSSGITLDSMGNVYINGETNSYDFPTTSGAFDQTYNNAHNNDYDGFISKLNNNGSKLIFSTFIGGKEFDRATSIVFDLTGNLYVVGGTYSPDFPITNNAIDSTLDAGDIFFIELAANGSSLLYSTFIGGSGYEFSDTMLLDSFGNIFITGVTTSTDFPNATGEHKGGTFDAILIQLSVLKNFYIESLSLIFNNTPVNKIYSRLEAYTFRVDIIDHISFSEIENIKLILDPNGSNIQLLWDRTTGKFQKVNDPNNYISLKQSSNASFDLIFKTFRKWTFYFNVTFNWTYPDEDFHDVNVQAYDASLLPSWLNASKFYNVENDLVFNGTLSVKGENNRILQENELVRGGEVLDWTGLTILYENTIDIYPPAEEVDVSIWDELDNFWWDSPELGENFSIKLTTPNNTNSKGFTYTINLTGIPPECDKTNHKFTIRIDADNVTFSNPWPAEDAWQKSSEVYTKITITDHGGGYVDNNSIMHCVSFDSGTTWSNWTRTLVSGLSDNISVHDFVILEDGSDNLIKWRAKDTLNNGPTESEPYGILVDTENIFFTQPIPTASTESPFEEVEVGITIHDTTSGIRASSIQYSISIDSGQTWGSWKSVTGLLNNRKIEVFLPLIFPNGTGNRIRWRGWDVAGNGPTISDEYIVLVNRSLQPEPPEVRLLKPENDSTITTREIELNWEILNYKLNDIRFNIYLDTTNSPQHLQKQNYTKTQLEIKDLEHDETYYWTVVPKYKTITGNCISGIWSFSVELPRPRAILQLPANNSQISALKPTLTWSLEYSRSDTVKYDLYFGETLRPELMLENLTYTYYSLETLLEKGKTYYWQVQPWAGTLMGYPSQVWSFTIETTETTPTFALNLTLEPASITLFPNTEKLVQVRITNLGTTNDVVSLKLWVSHDTRIGAYTNKQDHIAIPPNEHKELILTVLALKDVKEGDAEIQVLVFSDKAGDFNLSAVDEKILTVVIKEKEKSEPDEPLIGTSTLIALFIIFVIIIIFISMIFILAYLANRRKEDEDRENDEEKELAEEKIIKDDQGVNPERIRVDEKKLDTEAEE